MPSCMKVRIPHQIIHLLVVRSRLYVRLKRAIVTQEEGKFVLVRKGVKTESEITVGRDKTRSSRPTKEGLSPSVYERTEKADAVSSSHEKRLPTWQKGILTNTAATPPAPPQIYPAITFTHPPNSLYPVPHTNQSKNNNIWPPGAKRILCIGTRSAASSNSENRHRQFSCQLYFSPSEVGRKSIIALVYIEGN